MVNNIDVHRIQDLLLKPVGKKHKTQESSGTSMPEVAFDAEYGDLIATALRFTPADEYSVERARELITTGQLDTPEAVRTAATNIIQSGI